MNFIVAGRSFIIYDHRMNEHLWFVLTDPDDAGYVIIVMLVSMKPHSDRTVTVDVGDHDFVRHLSSVDYGTATPKLAKKLAAHIASGKARLHSDMSPGLLYRVRAGVVASARTPNDVRDSCKALFGTPGQPL